MKQLFLYQWSEICTTAEYQVHTPSTNTENWHVYSKCNPYVCICPVFNPLSNKINPNNIRQFSCDLQENRLHTLWGISNTLYVNNRCLYEKSFKVHNYILMAKFRGYLLLKCVRHVDSSLRSCYALSRCKLLPRFLMILVSSSSGSRNPAWSWR